MLAQAGGRQGILLYLPWEFDMLGGVDVVADRLWQGLEQRHPGLARIGVQDWMVSGDRSDAEGRRFLHLNLPAPEAGAPALSVRYGLTLLKRLPVVLRQLRERAIGVVNCHYPTLNVYPLALLKRLGLWRGRIVLSFHGSDANTLDAASPHWQLIAAQCDEITACSAALAERVAAVGLFTQPIQVVHNGIDCERFRDAPDKTPLPLAAPYILSVGNYVPRKAQDVLLEGFCRIAPAHPELRLVCVGGTDNGDWLTQLKALAERLGITGRVLFLENLPQGRVAALMRQAACLAHTAHAEPFGLVLIEAGVCAAPIVATRVGGIPEILPSADYGLLFPDGDVAALAAALDAVLRAPQEARARAERFHRRVLDCFSANAMVEGYLRVLAR